MKKIFLAIILAMSVVSIYAQKIDTDFLNELKARSIGPGGMSGRVTAIAVDQTNDAVIYVGTASGGIWKTTNGGVNFEPIFDEVEVTGIGALAIDPNNPDLIWAGTGEGNPRNSITGGFGLYKSLDAGRTWELVGLENTRHIHRILVHPRNGDVLYVGAIGSPWGPHKERGVYKSEDGGKSFEQILFVNDQTGVGDMIMDPSNPDKIFVAMWEHLRHPWFFTSGGKGSGLHMTVDGGENWKIIGDKEGLPKGELGRMGLAISKSNPDYVYAIVEAKQNAIYRSTDGGHSWMKRGDKNIGDRPFYYAEIYVDPSNENRIYSLYSNVNVSEDGGMTFRTLVGRSIHSDHHAWWIHPENPSFMIDGNDGGLAITHDKGGNWRHVTNLPVSQFYHIAVDNELPYNVYGGMQDNGSWRGPGYLWSYDGIINEYWDFMMGGDGFDVQPIPEDADYSYGMSQGGFLRRVNTKTGKSDMIMPAVEEDVKLRYHWNSALSLDPHNKNALYYGSQFVHKSTNRGDSWETISPDLTTNDTTRQKYDKTGGLTYDVTGAEVYTCILAIEPSVLNEDIIWVGTDDGNIQLTQDGGENWNNVATKIKDFPDRPWIPQIKASRYNEAEAFVVVNNYRQNDYAPYLYHTTDYGKSWNRMVEDSDVPGYVLSFIQDPVSENLMFLGTEYGLYVSINKGEDWVKYTNDYPHVSTMDMAIQEREADLILGTFGRSAYVIDDIRPLRKWAEQGDAFMEETIQAFPTRDAYMVSSKNAPGYYFHGDAYFKGENRRMGAMISYSVKEGKAKDSGRPSYSGGGRPMPGGGRPMPGAGGKAMSSDTALFKIIDQDGEVIRHFTDIPSTGINQTYWGFDLDGINLEFGAQGRRMAPRMKQKYPGGGGTALPGDYTVRIVFKGDSSETALKVHADPRHDYDLQGMKDRQVVLDELMADLEAFNAVVVRLNKASDQMGTVKTLAKGHDSDTLSSSMKAIGKKFAKFNTELNGETNIKGIYENEDLFSTKIAPLRYMSYMFSGPITPNLKITIDKARKELTEMQKQLETFLNEDWAAFKKLVEGENLSIF